ncbi:MAG: hypothetical protein HY516_00025 [Candidatus Aenigmarchaeota archaeon]|nr:hypothetical protein [Candidatus Aenigmarchaeota archaeon]
MPYKSFWRDFADGFLSAADRISVMRYEHSKLDPRKWEDYRRTTSPGVRAIQSYTLRDAYLLGDLDFVPDSKSVKAVKKELRIEYGFGTEGFLTGQGAGTFVAMISLGSVPFGFWIYSAIERRKEDRVRRHFNNLLREINST